MPYKFADLLLPPEEKNTLINPTLPQSRCLDCSTITQTCANRKTSFDRLLPPSIDHHSSIDHRPYIDHPPHIDLSVDPTITSSIYWAHPSLYRQSIFLHQPIPPQVNNPSLHLPIPPWTLPYFLHQFIHLLIDRSLRSLPLASGMVVYKCTI